MYIHAFDPENFTTCNNLAISRLIHSPNLIASLDEGVAATHVAVGSLEIGSLRHNGVPGVLTPRARDFSLGLMMSRGMQLFDGYGSQRGFSDEARAGYIRTYETEFRMEVIRRNVAPHAPSRLSCLWYADATPEGRATLTNMFGNQRRIIGVEPIAVLAQLTADPGLFEAFYDSQDEQYAYRYWAGEGSSGRREHLVDGALLVKDTEELKLLFQECEACGNRVPQTALDRR